MLNDKIEKQISWYKTYQSKKKISNEKKWNQIWKKEKTKKDEIEKKFKNNLKRKIIKRIGTKSDMVKI